MSQPSQSPIRVILFMVVLSVVCATILSVLASALKEPQEVAKELDRSTQMLIAARIISPEGYFLIYDPEKGYIPAKSDKEGFLSPSDKKIIATENEILAVYHRRIDPFLVDDAGNEKTFAEANLNEIEYTSTHRKTGYALLPLKLVYRVLPNFQSSEGKGELKAEGYVFPVFGFGLWDAIYGFIAIKPDGNTVIGISWYDHKETPGLGANIAEPIWQSQFPNKAIFQADTEGHIDFKIAPIGITVVRGKVSEMIGSGPKAATAVDGMPGATLTGNGVTKAYKDTLTPYRAFLIRLQSKHLNI